MAVEDDRLTGVSVNYPIVFLSGLVLVVGGILIFLLILKSIYGNFDLTELAPSPRNLSYIFVEKKHNVAILYSKYTESMFEEGSTWVTDNVDTWQQFARSSKLYFDLITDQQIENGDHFNYELLILPGVKALSEKQIVQIKAYLESGGSVFATGGIATFSYEGKWRGWKFFTETFGLKFTKEIKPREVYKIHTLRGNMPITAGIPTGYTLKIATWDRPIYAEILEPRTVQVSSWYDFRREAGLVRDEIEKSAGIAYGNYGEGRFVWFGFELNSVIGDQKDYINYNKLFVNCINWLTYRPIAYIKDWPPPYDAAAIFIPTVDENPGNANNLIAMLKSSQYPANFFIQPSVAESYPGIVKNLAKYGDVGAIVDIGFLAAADDTVNALYDKDAQFASIESAKSKIESLIEKPVNGIMPLYGFYDENTLQGMSSNDITYFVTDSLTDRSVPRVIIRNDEPILLMTKTARDDIEIVGEYGLKNPNFQRYTYEEDVDRILFESGLFVFKVHSKYQMNGGYVRVIDEILQYTRNKNMWLTNISDLKDWWLKRGRVELQYGSNSSVRMEVEVTNLAEEMIDNFVIEVNLNKKVENVGVSSDLVNTKIPEFEFNATSNILYLFIEDLEDGESRSFLIDFDNINL